MQLVVNDIKKDDKLTPRSGVDKTTVEIYVACFDQLPLHAVPQTNFTDKKIHPTQKPYNLIRRFVEFASNKNDTILDPFAGSGTTGAACQEDDRQCVLIEMEEGYAGIIEGRLQIKREK